MTRAQPRVRHLLRLADGGADRASPPPPGRRCCRRCTPRALLPAEAERAQRAVALDAARSGRRSWWCRCRARRRCRLRAVAAAALRRGGSIGGGRRDSWFIRGALLRLLRRRRVGCVGGVGAGAAGAAPAGRAGACRSRPAGGRAALARCCNSASRSIAAASWPSGSSTSVPLCRRRFQRRSPTRTSAWTRFCTSGARASARRAAARRQRSAPAPTTSGSWPNCGDVLGGDHAGPRGRSPRSLPSFCQIAKGGAPAGARRMVPGRRRSTWACSTQAMRLQPLRAPAAARSRASGRPAHAERGAQQRRAACCARPSTTHLAAPAGRRSPSTPPSRSRSAAQPCRRGRPRARAETAASTSAPSAEQRPRPARTQQAAAALQPEPQRASAGSARCWQPRLRRRRRVHAPWRACSTIQAQSCGEGDAEMRRLFRQQRGAASGRAGC